MIRPTGSESDFRDYSFQFNNTSIDLSLSTHYISHDLPKLSLVGNDVQSTIPNIENVTVIQQLLTGKVIVHNRSNCYGSRNPLIQGRCLGCQGKAAK